MRDLIGNFQKKQQNQMGCNFQNANPIIYNQQISPLER